MLDPRLERGRADRHVAAAGSPQPVHCIELKVIEDRLGRLLPRMIQIDALPQGTALSRAVKGNHGDAEFGQRQQKGIELLDERVVPAREDEHTALLTLCPKSEPRQFSAGIWNRDGLVTSDTFHSKSPRSREVIVESVAHFAGRQIELRAVVVGGGVQPPLLGFRAFGKSQPSCMPAIVVFDLGCDGSDLLETGR